MTNKEQQAVKEWNIRNGHEQDKEQSKLWNEMYEMVRVCGGTLYCNMTSMLLEVLKSHMSQATKDRACRIQEQYYTAQGKIDALSDYIHTVNK